MEKGGKMKQEVFNKIVGEVTESAIKTFVEKMIEEEIDGFSTEEMKNLLSSVSASITINIINLHKKKIETSLGYLVAASSYQYSILLYEKYLGKEFRDSISNHGIKTEITGIAKKEMEK
jgi:hypothetical protein